MPSRNNPNLPSSLNRRVLSHRRTKSRARSATSGESSRQEPAAPIPKSLAGVVRGRTVAPKKLQKMARNQNYALQRKDKLMAGLPKTRGEVEMTGMLKGGRALSEGRGLTTGAAGHVPAQTLRRCRGGSTSLPCVQRR